VPRTFELDHPRAGLQAAQRCLERTLRRRVGAERQVGDQQCMRQAACDATHVVDDVVDGHRQRAVVSLHDHAERIADEHEVDAVLVHDARESRVVGGEHDELAAIALRAGQHRHGPGLGVGARIHDVS
jgi:hypothetical protein